MPITTLLLWVFSVNRVVQFNSSNWESIYSFSATAGILSDTTYIPIPPAQIPIFLESDIVAVYVSTDVPTGKRWRFGGYVEQRFATGFLVGGNADSAGEPKNIWVDKITTIFFPKITAQYSLKAYFPKWFKSVELQVWQYTGIDDTSERILMAEEFSNLNFKLDQINTKL
jgi:hypothetical protein